MRLAIRSEHVAVGGGRGGDKRFGHAPDHELIQIVEGLNEIIGM